MINHHGRYECECCHRTYGDLRALRQHQAYSRRCRVLARRTAQEHFITAFDDNLERWREEHASPKATKP